MWLHFKRKSIVFNIAYSRWSGSRHFNCKPCHSHSCTYHSEYSDFLAIPPKCYLYCLRAFALPLLSVWNALIPDISMTPSFTEFSGLCSNVTFSERLSLTTYIKCLFNPPPFPTFIFVCIYSAYFPLQHLSLTVHYIIYLFDCLLSGFSTRMWQRLSPWPNSCQAPLSPNRPHPWARLQEPSLNRNPAKSV